MHSDQIAERIREMVFKHQQRSAHVGIPVDTQQESVLSGIRTLARSRVSNVLRQLRAVTGYSYDEVTAATGLSKQMLFDMEYKERRLTFEELCLLADCYQVSVNDILGVDID